MYAVVESGLQTGLAGTVHPVRCALRLRQGRLSRSANKLRVRASCEDSTRSRTTLQSRVLGLGLGLALSLGVTAVPANADTLQDIQNAASGTTLGQTVQSLTSGNPLEGLQRQTQSAADSTTQAASSSAPALQLPEAASIGDSLKEAFTTSPPQIANKQSLQSAQAPDSTNFPLAAGVAGGAVLLVASSLLSQQGKGASKAAAKQTKSSASKISGSQPAQKAKGLLGNARSKGTQSAKSATKQAQGGLGSQLSRAKSAGAGKASSAAQQAQQKVGGGSIPVAGLAAAGLVAAGVVLAVIAKPQAADAPVNPFDTSSTQETIASAGESVQDGAEAAKQKGSEAAQQAFDVTDKASSQEQQGSNFDLTLSDGKPGPNSEPLNLRPSVDQVDAPKAGGIPIFSPKGQQESGAATATPEEEGDAQQSIVKPGGYKSKPQAGQDVSPSNPQEALASAGASAQEGAESAKQEASQAVQQVAEALDVTDSKASQEQQGSAFDLTLSDGKPGPNSEPLNLRPSVDQIDAPKAGGIPIFSPKGQQDSGAATATPEEEGDAQQSIVKPGGYKSKPQAGQDVSAVDPQEALASAGASAQEAAEAANQEVSQATQEVAEALDVIDRVPPQDAQPQGSAFDLSLSDGKPGPNSEPLNLRPSVDQVDAPKAGGIPIFSPKGQQESGAATATPEEEGDAQQSIVKPGGYKSKPQAGQDLSQLDLAASVPDVQSKAGEAGNKLASALTSKGNPQQEQKTDQRLEPQGPAAQAQRSADQAALSRSDEDRVDRDT